MPTRLRMAVTRTVRVVTDVRAYVITVCCADSGYRWHWHVSECPRWPADQPAAQPREIKRIGPVMARSEDDAIAHALALLP